MTGPHSRRRFLAGAVPVALAGCLVAESDEGPEPADATVADTSGDGDAAGDDVNQAGGTNETEATGNASETERLPAGIEIERVDVVRLVESDLLSQIVVDVVVRNPGGATYGTLELRVDAYYEPPDDDRTYHPPRVDERSAVGREYTERTFEEFGSGTRTIEDVVIQYDADADANDSTDPDEFDFEVVVRRAEPL